MRLSLKKRIKDYLMQWRMVKPEAWIHKGQLEALAKEAGYLAENCNRRCRELVEEGWLERRLNKKGCVEYRWTL